MKAHRILSIVTTIMFIGIALILMGFGIYLFVQLNSLSGAMVPLFTTDYSNDPNSVIGGWQVLGNLGLIMSTSIGIMLFFALIAFDIIVTVLFSISIFCGIVFVIIDFVKDKPVFGIIDAAIKVLLIGIPMLLAVVSIFGRINVFDISILLMTLGIIPFCIAQLVLAILAQRKKVIKK